ncbi:Oidioi.mRNA.OKI2018_I69.chr1.g3526.t1.cds [Oikopleura dioica]|uniref:Oidioi.mRNA.OKI2018_I69.chr1.g3526.t1.cds n=1 Tax=Oikopleura dioica TaxID=34765 RepID=A0ABN7SUZ6_OIKDI|nr:Oidioi.mRNA.OKI2018_I69.chr1.g3526.t1.cds [Oikopleura dioica]
MKAKVKREKPEIKQEYHPDDRPQRRDQGVQTDTFRNQDDKKIIAELRKELENSARRYEKLKSDKDKIVAMLQCDICGEKPFGHCCLNHFYCSKECQKVGWITGHMQICKKRLAKKRPQSNASETPNAEKKQKTA